MVIYCKIKRIQHQYHNQLNYKEKNIILIHNKFKMFKKLLNNKVILLQKLYKNVVHIILMNNDLILILYFLLKFVKFY